MKMLTVSALLCALMALTTAAATRVDEEINSLEGQNVLPALPGTEDEPGTEGTIVQALPDAEAGNSTDLTEGHVVKRSTPCPGGWTELYGRCFLYVPRTMTWPQAERNCLVLGGNLASVHNIQEYRAIQNITVRITPDQREAWIGGSDAEENGFWLWSDGTGFYFSNWCPGEPINDRWQNCLQMNYSAPAHRTTEATDADKEEEKIILQQVIIIFDICIISTMKMLTVSALLCAMMALTTAAALPGAGDEPGTEGTIVQALPDAEAGNSTDLTAEGRVVKRSTSCPGGWTELYGRCFLYVPRTMKWAQAEKNCLSMGGNLASVHNVQEYHAIQNMIVRITHDQREAWIGGSDAVEKGYWFWSDGTPFYFSNWCPGEPNNYRGWQNCALMNYSGQKCWDDMWCDHQFPSVCVRKG
ncbi:C-type mannose receptor 2-like isoform X5 [Siniperca chuatsi]|uniref:C-type mannose receptor 2-like isoform X5 n=1 Tax=Siniperca chuatsi TaxID=119488 RepID=UPI001CE0A280|nr:C-type mannose receptor 2-like isoform X5 [Siniperca chuatsi]